MFLFEGGSEASGTGVAVEAEGSRCVNNCVPVREDKYWGCCEFREKGANGVLHCGGEIERGALFQKGRYRTDVVSHVGQELAVVAQAAKDAAKLFDVRRHWMRVRAATRLSLGRTPSAEMTWPEKSTRATPIRDLSGESSGLWRCRRAKKVASVAI